MVHTLVQAQMLLVPTIRSLGMWSAHAYGLKFNNTLYTTENGLPNNRVRGVAIDAQDQVWVATADGEAHRRWTFL